MYKPIQISIGRNTVLEAMRRLQERLTDDNMHDDAIVVGLAIEALETPTLDGVQIVYSEPVIASDRERAIIAAAIEQMTRSLPALIEKLKASGKL